MPGFGEYLRTVLASERQTLLRWCEAMSEFQPVCRTADVPEGQGRCFPVNGQMVGIFRDGGQFFAINDFCPHMGASLSDGHVENGVVLCPWHAWSFRLSDGAWTDNSKSGIRTATYPVRLDGETVEVAVPDAEGSSPDSSGDDSAASSGDSEASA